MTSVPSLTANFSSASLSTNVLIVNKITDLPVAVDNEITLPGKVVLFTSTIDLGNTALRYSTNTVLRGLAGATIISTATGGVVRATNINSALLMREINIVALAGPCLNLVGTTAHQLNLFFCGFFGASVGTISGFDVQSYKDCFINCADGMVFTGTSNKLFVSQCPFYGITVGNAAMTFAAALNVKRVDIIAPFFKHDAAGIPMRAIAGYTVEYGRVSAAMSEDITTMLEGLSSSDNNWWFRECNDIRNSRVAAQAALIAETTTAVASVGVYVPIVGALSLATLTQRFTLNAQNELVYAGVDPVTVTFNGAVNVDPTNNVRIGFRAVKNGATLDYSQAFIEQGSGAGSQARPASVVALIELMPGDRVSMALANLTNTTSVDVEALTYAVFA